MRASVGFVTGQCRTWYRAFIRLDRAGLVPPELHSARIFASIAEG